MDTNKEIIRMNRQPKTLEQKFNIAVCAFLWKLYKDSESYSRCPNCGKVWAGENMKESCWVYSKRAYLQIAPLPLRGHCFRR
jgi:hypothetical protein